MGTNQSAPTSTVAPASTETQGTAPTEGAAGESTATTAPAATETTAPAGPKLKVVATFSILADLVQSVGGELVEVRSLVPPGGDAHTFEPTPADTTALAEAGLIFEHGLGFDGWLEDLYQASGSQASRVEASFGITPLQIEQEEVEEHGHEEEDEHGHGEADPHLWMDVTNVITMVNTIEANLADADPANAQVYAANAAAYRAELEALDAEIVQQADTLPAERRKLVTSHDTFNYFARRYGFEVVGVVLGLSTEASDPSAGELVALVEQIKAAGVPAIFAENVQDTRLVQRVADEAGVAIAPPLYTDALGEPGSAGDSYLKLMRANTATIVEALK